MRIYFAKYIFLLLNWSREIPASLLYKCCYTHTHTHKQKERNACTHACTHTYTHTPLKYMPIIDILYLRES